MSENALKLLKPIRKDMPELFSLSNNQMVAFLG